MPKTRALSSGSTFLPYFEITKNFLGDTVSGKHKFLLKVGEITFREQSRPSPYLFCFPRGWVLARRKSDVARAWKTGTSHLNPLRESDPEFHEFAVKTEISDFFISGQEKPFGDLFTKITIELSKEFLFSRNSAKREMPYLLRSRHEILLRFGVFSKRSGRTTAQRTEMIF